MAVPEVPLIPREVLLGNPEKASPGLSPDGRWISYLAPAEGVLNVWVGPSDGSAEPEPLTSDRDRGVRAYFWSPAGDRILYIQDAGGDENWRLYATDITTRETVDLTPFEGVQAQVVAAQRHHPEAILVGLNKDNPQLHDVYRLDLKTNELVKVADNPGFIGWAADHDLVVRGAMAPTPDGGLAVLVRDSEEADWRPILQVGQEDALSTQVLGFTGDNKGLYVVTSAGVNAGRLVVLSTATGEVERVIVEDPTFDVSDALLHQDTFEVQLVYVAKARIEHVVVDPAIADDVAGIKALDGGDFIVVGRDLADTTWLVAFTTDAGSVRYFTWDRATKTGRLLFVQRPVLDEYELAAMEPFTFESRDGLTIHGYLTFPPGVERTNLPTVLNVHGGPWGRDMWGYHPEAQWMANRGYLCVQVNFRGSTGYGKDFVNAGDREWGAKMHDDLLDAVDWVVEQGYADRERIAIYGGSYGGYAALVGVTFTPDVFCCGVDIVGPSNIKTLIESIPPYWAPMIAQFHTRVGNPETDEEFMWSRSPLSKVDQIKVPLLIAQGANDPRVKQAESEQIVEAMKERGIPHEYLLFPDEGHGFAKPENRLRFYAAAEKFLARNLGGRCEEQASQLAEDV